MAITRRQFLKRSSLMAAGSVLGPGLWGNPFVRQAMASHSNRFFVVLFLNGGNDGLNTIVPYNNGSGTLRSNYQTARSASSSGGLRLTTTQLQNSLIGTDPNTGAQLALHPGFADPATYYPGGLKALYDLGDVAVIQGCGYPNYNLSHEESSVIWQTANPLGNSSYAGTGWMGRYLTGTATDPPPPFDGDDIPGVTIADSVAAEYRQTGTSVLAIRRLNRFGFPYDEDSLGDASISPLLDQSSKETAFGALYSEASGPQSALDYLGTNGSAMLVATNSYPPLHGLYLPRLDEPPMGYTWNNRYEDLDNGTARNFREVAKIIYGVKTSQPNVNAHFFQLANGGYDTHSDQGASTGQHYDLHREVGNAIRLFREDCVDMGVWNDVTILVWSEFSRRVPQNDNGTDHGSQGPMFVIGGSVNGGVYGNHPNIASGALDGGENTVYTQNANPFRSTDFRDVYGTVLKRWLSMDPGVITSSVLPLDAGPAASYWTVANFDLPFLP